MGATTLLSETCFNSEAGKAEAINDFSILTVDALASLTAGANQIEVGWRAVRISEAPLLLIFMLSMIWLWLIAVPQTQRVIPETAKLLSGIQF